MSKLRNTIEHISSSSVNPWVLLDKSWANNGLNFEETIIMEAIIFNELYIYTRGLAYSDELRPYFLKVITDKYKFETAENEDTKWDQMETILSIYQRHYSAIQQIPDIRYFYLLLLEVYDITKSEKKETLLRLYKIIDPVRLHNGKYKVNNLEREYNNFYKFWENVGFDNLPSRTMKDRFIGATSIKGMEEAILMTAIKFQEDGRLYGTEYELMENEGEQDE